MIGSRLNEVISSNAFEELFHLHPNVKNLKNQQTNKQTNKQANK